MNDRVVGFNAREDETWRRFATLFAWLLTAQTGKVFRGRDLLPAVFPDLPVLSEEENKKELQEIKNSVGIK